MSQPLNSTIFAPIWRWTAFSAVFRMAVVMPVGVVSTEDNIDLNQRAAAGVGALFTVSRGFSAGQTEG
jgi:hypothetical protein